MTRRPACAASVNMLRAGSATLNVSTAGIVPEGLTVFMMVEGDGSTICLSDTRANLLDLLQKATAAVEAA